MNHKNRHISHEFEQRIILLREEVSIMGGLARLNLDRAMQGLRERDLDLCKIAIADDAEVDEAERRIDALGLEILARFHPVASDLRLVLSSMKIASNLERIADHAVNMAKRAKKILAYPEIQEAALLDPLHDMATGLLERALASFLDRSAALGESLSREDDQLDRAEKRVVATFSSYLEQGGDRAEVYLHLIFMARSLERIGDLAVNIGEDAVFLVSARDLRHLKTETKEEGRRES